MWLIAFAISGSVGKKAFGFEGLPKMSKSSFRLKFSRVSTLKISRENFKDGLETIEESVAIGCMFFVMIRHVYKYIYYIQIMILLF